MGTTICPLSNGGPFDTEGGLNLGGLQTRRLREASKKNPVGSGNEFTGKESKKFMDEAMGVKTQRKPKVKTASVESQRQRPPKGKKKGPFGESYTPVSAPNKGVRTKESLGSRLAKFGRKDREAEEKAPPGREDQVKALKKTDVDNPFAVAWSSYNNDKGKEARMGGLI